MTLESAPPASDIAPTAVTSSTDRRRKRVVLAASALALGVLALVAWGSFSALAQSAVGGVRVGYDAQPIRCDGAEVALVPDVANIEFLQPVIALTEGMTCELRVQVVNRGWSDVTVTDVAALGMGADNILGLEAQLVNPNGQERSEATEENAAVFEIASDLIVTAGESSTFTIVFGYGGGAMLMQCSAQGWNPPLVTVTALGATREVAPGDENTIWAREGTAAECAE